MLRLRHIVLALLAFGVVTLWVPALWARSALEGAIFLLTAALIVPRARRGVWPPLFFPLAAVLGVCLWVVAQLCFRWTAVEALTREALLYWFTAACLVWLGSEACRLQAERIAFFKNAVAVGSVICFAGIVQLYTSMGLVFWIFPSGYDTGVTGPFVSANHFACFVELLLPAALALAAQLRAGTTAYLLTAGGLAAAVIASGSRTGTVIVVVESSVLLLWHCRSRRTPGARGAGVRFGLFAAAGMLVFGCQSLLQRFWDSRNSFALRREFLKSALAMFRAHPLTGFGLGTWSSVYRQFARFDAGAVVNHAHNEWAQWAAEGGVVTVALMAAVLVWIVKPARRTRWGLGVLAVFAHSLVDYPFARLGLSAWIFVWIGALAAAHAGNAFPEIRVRRLPLSRTIGVVLCVILLLAAGDSVRIAYADTLYRRGDPTSVARAAGLCPDRAEYWTAMAAVQPERALSHLRRALVLDPHQTGARISLANELERRGEFAASEGELLESARLDHQLAPAWAAANFYFRSGRSEFWHWAARSASLMQSNMDSLFDLCFLVSGDVGLVEKEVADSNPASARGLLDYLVAKGRAGEAAPVALRVAHMASVGDRDSLLDYIDRVLPGDAAAGPVAVWNELCARGLLSLTPIREATLVNGDLQSPPSGRGFDWRLAANPGVCTIPGGRLLKVTFSGSQPENCEILSQWVRVRPGTAYCLRFEYRTDGLPSETGLQWSVAPRLEASLASAPDWNPGEYRFHSRGSLACLRLGYRRRIGSTRISGALWLRQISLNSLQKDGRTADKT